MGTAVSIDGVQYAEGDAKISVFDRGFLYGDSVFEVLRTYHGVPFGEREHLERLERSCSLVLIPMPVSLHVLRDEMRDTLQAAGNEDAYIRIVITRGGGPVVLDPMAATNPSRVILVLPLRPQPPELYRDGVEVALIRAARATDDTRAAGAKASNYLANMLALHEAKKRGAYEAIVVGASGEVIEGASSNVFAVKDGVLRTPPAGSGLLEGITRAVVLRVAREEGIPVEETTLEPRDLYGAEECFLTSTLREVVPIVRIDGRPVGGARPGPITARLHAGYRRAVEEECGPGGAR